MLKPREALAALLALGSVKEGRVELSVRACVGNTAYAARRARRS